MAKRAAFLLALGGIALFGFSFIRFHAETPATPPARRVSFELKDLHGKKTSLAQFQGKKALVVVFIGTECPINNAFMPKLSTLWREYEPRGVQFIAINANCQDTLDRMIAHAMKYEIPFPVLKDEGNVVADQMGARRTPEAFVLDPSGQILYQGRIDDQFGIGYKRFRAQTRELAQGLDELLAGKPVSQPLTAVAGCLISRASKPHDGGSVTFTRDVAPILQNRCQECHRKGSIAPMPLMTYEDAAAWAETIREAVSDGRMPPWYADPHYGKFSNDHSLSPRERETLLAWIQQATPRGDERDMPPPREFVEGWMIGKPDVVLTMSKEFAVPADMPKGGVPYKEFMVDTNFKEDRWVVRAECKPGAPEVVHHIVTFVVPPGKRFWPGNPQTPILSGTAPGDLPMMLPPGVGIKVPAGAQICFQMHYTPNGRAQRDRSSIGLVFAREKPKHEVRTEPILNPAFLIPAGDDNYQVESWFPPGENETFSETAHIVGFMPHMHLRGKDFLYEAIYPDGRKETLLRVPHYNFNWQSAYRCVEPVVVPKGTRLHCVAHFDNSAKNPNNPNPHKPVTWGDQTWEEMMIGWMDYYYDRPAS